MSASRQAINQSQSEVIVFLLLFLTYFAGFAKGKLGPLCAKTVPKVMSPRPPGPRTPSKATSGPTKTCAAKVNLPITRRFGDADTHLIQTTDWDCLPSDASTLSELVGACARLNHTEVALYLFDHMLKNGVACDQQTLSPKIASKFFKIVATSLDDKRMQKDGVQLMRTILAFGLSPTNFIQNQLIRSWRSKLPDHVMEMFLDMQKKGVHLTATAYRCVMAAHERTEPALTLQLYNEVLDRGIKIDRVAFNAVLCACSCLGMTEKALELFEQMPAYGLAANGKTYGAIIRVCTSSNRVEQALRLFESMRAAGFEPNCFALRDAIHCCVKTGHLEKAYELYKSMVRVSTIPCGSTYTYILEACQKNGCMWIADRIKADMKDVIWTRTGDTICGKHLTEHVTDSGTVSPAIRKLMQRAVA